jgi:hypothetical protein
MATIILDIDDVQIPWAETVHQACIDAGIAPSGSVWRQWEMWHDYPDASKEDWLRVVDSLVVPDGLYHAQPYPGVVEAVWKLYEAGHMIHFVTARGFFAHSQEIRNWTREWIGANYSEVPVTLWFSQNKGRVAKQIGASYSLDDSMKNVIDLSRAGTVSYLMNQPHNAEIDYPSELRVNSVAEFAERILNG